MRRIAVSPYLLLVLTTLFWSGNFVLARFVRLEVPPVGLSFWRWVFAAVLLLPFVWRDMRRHWPLVRANLKLVLALALFGVASFNTLIYLGLQTTTASNAVLLQSAMPLVIILLSRLLLQINITATQAFGILVSLGGVLIIVTRGNLDTLLGIDLVQGDLLVMTAVVAWGLYSVLLKRLPPGLGGLSLLGYFIAFGVVFIAPVYAWEISSGTVMPLGWVTVNSVLYVAVFPSLLAYLFWNRAVREVGPNRAGQFIHLMPVFGTLLSVVFLGERLYRYHLFGILLVALGIYLATLWGNRRKEPQPE